MEQFLKWQCAWAKLFEGIAGILTFGFWSPLWALSTAKRLSRWRCSHGKISYS